MNRYTLDTQGLLYYLVDVLPDPADAVFDDAIDGSAVIRLPTIAAAEALYKVEKNDAVKGTELAADPDDVVAGLESFIPVSVVGGDLALVRELPDWIDEFPSQIHDAMIVAEYVSSGADAVITGDPKIDAHVTTVWD